MRRALFIHIVELFLAFRRSFLASALLCVAVSAPSSAVAAQAVAGIGDDAIGIPRGSVRIGISNSWQRYDRLYAANGAPLGAAFSGDVLGANQVESLGPLQDRLRSLTGISNLSVGFGTTRVSLDRLVRTSPVLAELGVTNWLSVSVMIPVVLTRTEVNFFLNPKRTEGTVGFNPAVSSTAARDTNTQLLGQLQNARDQLTGRIASCRADASGADCGQILATGESINNQSQQFSAGLTQIYDATTSAFVPVARSAADVALRARVQALAAQYQGFGVNAITLPGPAAAAMLNGASAQQLFTTPGYGFSADSLQTIERFGVGDIELGARLQLWNSLSGRARFDPPAGLRTRSALAAIVRLGTGSPHSPSNFVDVGTGDGQTDVELRSRNDLVFGRRFWASVTARYGWQLADERSMRIAPPSIPFPAEFRTQRVRRDLGDYFELEATPRIVLASYFAIEGQYQYSRKPADRYAGVFTATSPAGDQVHLDASVLDQGTASSAQHAAIGFVYSTADAYSRRDAWLPMDVSYQHLETITGSGAAPKLSQDVIRLRVYLQLFGGDRR